MRDRDVGRRRCLRTPCFVTTTRAQADVARDPTTFSFITHGVAATVDRARTAAGDDDVIVVGGVRIVQQCLELGLVDEVRLHVMPVLLGGGSPLFGASPRATNSNPSASSPPHRPLM